jgi:hypothetical protein
MPLKRAARGLLPLLEAAEQEFRHPGKQDETSSNGDEELSLVRNAKGISLFTLGLAHNKYGKELEQQQEIVMSLSDLFMETFAMESALLRCRKLVAAGNTGARDICAVFTRDALARIQNASQNVLGGCSAGEPLRRNMAALRSYSSFEPVNAIALRRKIANQLLSTERYGF